jgi:hypothetical protein
MYSPTDAQVNGFKNNFKLYIKIDIKTAQDNSLVHQLVNTKL